MVLVSSRCAAFHHSDPLWRCSNAFQGGALPRRACTSAPSPFTFARSRPRSFLVAVVPGASPIPRPAQTQDLQSPTASDGTADAKTISIMGRSVNISRRLMLYCVPVLLSTFVVCAKVLYLLPRALSPAAFNTLRLAVAALIQLPTLIASVRKRQRAKILVAGAELGVLNFATNCAQIIGLKHTLASRAAFLNQFQVVLVPVIAATVGLEVLSGQVIVSALLALVGVGVLTFGGGISALALSFLGDSFELLAALISSVYILRVGHHVKDLPYSIAGFMAVKAAVQASLSAMWMVLGNMRTWWLLRSLPCGTATSAVRSAFSLVASASAWTPSLIAASAAVVLWCGVMVAWFAAWLHFQGQTAVSASETTIIFTTQPLWASLFATVLLGETFGPSTMIGAALIVAGSVLSSWRTRDSSDY